MNEVSKDQPYYKHSYKYLKDLQKALNFTDEDLQANREGYMTKRQRQRMNQFRQDTRSVRIALVVMAILIAILILPSLEKEIQPIAIFCAILPVGAVIISSFDIRHMNEDLHKGLVDVVEGEIRKSVIQNRSSTYYYVELGQKKFSISGRVFRLLNEGSMYWIYFAPTSSTALSMEGVDDLAGEIEDSEATHDSVHFIAQSSPVGNDMAIHIVESGLSTKMSAVWLAVEAINKSEECVLNKPHSLAVYRVAGQFHIYRPLIASTGKIDLHYVISNQEDVLEKLNKDDGDDLTTVLNSLADENTGKKQVDKDSNLIVQKHSNDAQKQMRRIKNYIRYHLDVMQDIKQTSRSNDDKQKSDFVNGYPPDPKSPLPRKFHVFTFTVIALTVILTPISAGFRFEDKVLEDGLGMLSYLLLMVSIVFSVYCIMSIPKSLVIFEDGLEWRRGSSKMFVGWQDMMRLKCDKRFVKGKGTVITVYIILNRLVVPEARLWVDKRLFSYQTDSIRINDI